MLFIIHRDIRDIIQLTEDANLRELGDTCQEDKTKLWLTHLERTIEIMLGAGDSFTGAFVASILR